MNKNELQIWFIENQPILFEKMKNTEHGYNNVESNPYHLEGSIWNHTKMVMNICEERFSSHTFYFELLLISLLHDIGKTETFEDSNNRRSFKGHESFSYFMAISIIEELSYCINTNLVLKTIANHGSLYQYFDDGVFLEKYYNKIAKMYQHDSFSLEILRDFYVCDHLGRIQEQNTCDIQKTIDSFNMIINSIDNLDDIKIMNNTITCLIGLPRSGKSTYSENLDNVISRDYYVELIGIGNNYSEKFKSLTEDEQKKIDELVLKEFNKCIKEKKDVIIDMTNLSKKSRRRWSNSKYSKKAVLFRTSVRTCSQRNTPDKFIPTNVFKIMMKRFVYPDYEEFDSIDVI